jgi:hypothetical protein
MTLRMERPAGLTGVLAGCAEADPDVVQDKVRWHGEQCAVGAFEPQAAQDRDAGTPREGTPVVDRSGS